MLKKTILIVGVLLVLGCGKPSRPGNSGPKLQSKNVDNVALNPIQVLPAVEALIPDGFTKMGEAMLRTKYPGANRPSIVYTNEQGSVNIAFNHTSNKLSPSQIDQLHVQLDSSIRAAQPNAKWMFSGKQIYRGKNWAQLEFQSVAVDTTIHNMMVATSVSGRMLAISFNCTDELASEWLGVGREIIQTVVVSD